MCKVIHFKALSPVFIDSKGHQDTKDLQIEIIPGTCRHNLAFNCQSRQQVYKWESSTKQGQTATEHEQGNVLSLRK